MTKKEKPFSFIKSFFLLAMCFCLIFGLYTQTVKSTVAYVTSLSATCVNTFTSEEKPDTEKPIEPENPEVPKEPEVPEKEPTKPKEPVPSTGDNSRIGWYIAAMLISMSAMAILFFYNGKEAYTGVSNKKEKTRRRK